MKLFAKNERELEYLIKVLKIFHPDRWIEFGFELQ